MSKAGVVVALKRLSVSGRITNKAYLGLRRFMLTAPPGLPSLNAFRELWFAPTLGNQLKERLRAARLEESKTEVSLQNHP